MTRLSASEILRRHARERYLRAGIRSANLDGDLGAVPRMSESAWIDSCQLVAGVPAELLDVLGVRECEAVGVVWNQEAREVMGVVGWHPTEQVAQPPTLVQAAERLGLKLGHDDLRRMRLAAIAKVTENQLTRRGRERGAAA